MGFGLVRVPLAGLLLAAGTPALAQEAAAGPPVRQPGAVSLQAEDEKADPFAMLSGLFAVEPLTAEQEARLPQATAIIARLVPDGAMAEMMGTMFDRIIKPMEDLGRASPDRRVADALGVGEFDLELTEAEAQEIADMFDPAFEEREAREMALMPEMMQGLMSALEPPLRKAMAELYAINFNESELRDIDAFFATPTGAVYARRSFAMASDPRIMAATMEAMPGVMGPIGEIEQRVKAATADLPPVRSYAELTARERARITALTGLAAEDIEEWTSSGEDWSDEAWDTADDAGTGAEAAEEHRH